MKKNKPKQQPKPQLLTIKGYNKFIDQMFSNPLKTVKR